MARYVVVDAAMRQLRSTGWMHKRARRITASFLTKDLLIDWREGARFFFRHLVDGDPASNSDGWQWAASTGTDSQRRQGALDRFRSARELGSTQ